MAQPAMKEAVGDKVVTYYQVATLIMESENRGSKDLANVRTELVREIGDVKDELGQRISGVKDELGQRISGVKDELVREIGDAKAEIQKDMRAMQAKLIVLVFSNAGVTIAGLIALLRLLDQLRVTVG